MSHRTLAPGVRRVRLADLAGLLLAASVLACGDADRADPTLTVVSGPPPASAAAEPQPLVIAVADDQGRALEDVQVDAAVTLGGGTIEPASARTDAAGRATFSWTIGRAPVRNEAVASVADASVAAATDAVLATPYEPRPFGDVNAYLTGLGVEGSTEDLAFAPDGERLVMGVPGGLIALDPAGRASQIPLTGDPIVGPLGIAFDRSGDLWVADGAGGALRRVTPSGVVTTELATDGERPLDAPNYVAIGRDGRVYLSDPCLGELIRFDPARGVVDAVLRFDLPTEGGPNGFAFDASGTRLWLATENTGLLCGHPFVGITDPIASLFAIDVTDAGFGTPETVVADFALFGDGVAFDVEGNLYAIFDTERDFMLEESAVWVLPAGGSMLEKLAAVRGRVLANLAFGPPATDSQGAFGAGEVYLALLAVPPFTPASARGAEVLDVGIPGLPLLP